MVRTLKIFLAAALAAMMMVPALAWAASSVTATFDKPAGSKNIAYVYLHGLGTTHTVRVDLTATDSTGKTISWDGTDAAATFVMAPWLKEAASVAENTYTGNEMVVVVSNGNNRLPTDATNTPDNYFIGTVMTTGDDPIYIGIPEIQVTTGTSPEVVTPGAGDDYLASVEMNVAGGNDPNDPNDPNNPNRPGQNGSNDQNVNLGNAANNSAGSGSQVRPNNTTGSGSKGGDLAKTGDETDLVIGGLLAAVALAGTVVVITAVSRKTRTSQRDESLR